MVQQGQVYPTEAPRTRRGAAVGVPLPNWRARLQAHSTRRVRLGGRTRVTHSSASSSGFDERRASRADSRSPSSSRRTSLNTTSSR